MAVPSESVIIKHPVPRVSFFTFHPELHLGSFATPGLLLRIDRALDLLQDIWKTFGQGVRSVLLVSGFSLVILVIYAVERGVASRGKFLIVL